MTKHTKIVAPQMLHTMIQNPRHTRIYLVSALRMLKQRGLLESEDTIIYLSSSFGVAGGTTFLEINHVDTIINNADHFLLPNFPAVE